MDPAPVETARRIGAAMAYAELGKANGQVRRELSQRLSVSPRTLDRMLGKGVDTPRPATWDELAVIADYCGLPPEWFSADLGRLHLIVPTGGFMVRRELDSIPAARPVPEPEPQPPAQTGQPARTAAGAPSQRAAGRRKTA